MKKIVFAICALVLFIVCGCSAGIKLTREDFCVFDENGNMTVDIDKAEDGEYLLFSEGVTDVGYCTNRGISIGSSLPELVTAYEGITAERIYLSGTSDSEKYENEKIDILKGDSRDVASDARITLVNDGYCIEFTIEDGCVRFINFYNQNSYKKKLSEKEQYMNGLLGDEKNTPEVNSKPTESPALTQEPATSPVTSPETSTETGRGFESDDILTLLKGTLTDTDQIKYEMSYQEDANTYHLYMDCPNAGLAEIATAIINGDTTNINEWDSIKETAIDLCNTIMGTVRNLGNGNEHATVNIRNDKNANNLLISVYDGTVVYDAATES